MTATANHEICPICGKPAAALSRPFCSGRCKDVELSGVYAVPVSADEDEDESPGEQR